MLAQQPESARDAFRVLAGSAVDLDNLHLWRPGATYAADRPEATFSEDSLRTHATVALNIAAITADQCRRQGISGSALARYDCRHDRCDRLIDEPIRYLDTADRG